MASVHFLLLKNIPRRSEKAIEWANQFPSEDERMRETILGQMGASWQTRYDGNGQWVKSMKDDKASLRVMDNLLTQWALKMRQCR